MNLAGKFTVRPRPTVITIGATARIEGRTTKEPTHGEEKGRIDRTTEDESGNGVEVPAAVVVVRATAKKAGVIQMALEKGVVGKRGGDVGAEAGVAIAAGKRRKASVGAKVAAEAATGIVTTSADVTITAAIGTAVAMTTKMTTIDGEERSTVVIAMTIEGGGTNPAIEAKG